MLCGRRSSPSVSTRRKWKPPIGKTWETNGGEVVELTDAERAEFVARVQPLRDDLRRELGSDLVPELP